MTTVQPIGSGFQYYPEIKKVKEFPDHYEYTFKDEASTGKKWGVGIASAFIGGLGQAINGQWGKAAGFFAGTLATGFLTKVNKPLGFISGLGVEIWSIVDAVKNAGGEYTQIVPKNQTMNIQG